MESGSGRRVWKSRRVDPAVSQTRLQGSASASELITCDFKAVSKLVWKSRFVFPATGGPQDATARVNNNPETGLGVNFIASSRSRPSTSATGRSATLAFGMRSDLQAGHRYRCRMVLGFIHGGAPTTDLSQALCGALRFKLTAGWSLASRLTFKPSLKLEAATSPSPIVAHPTKSWLAWLRPVLREDARGASVAGTGNSIDS